MRSNGGQLRCTVCGASYYVPKYRLLTSTACSESCAKRAKTARIFREQGDIVKQLYLEGNSIRQVAHLRRLNHRTVLKILSTLGVPTRSKTEAIRQTWRNGRISWGSVRKNHRLTRQRGQCDLCGATGSLEIHHIDGHGSNLPYNLRNEALDNLQLLCRSCHSATEKEREAGPYAKARAR